MTFELSLAAAGAGKPTEEHIHQAENDRAPERREEIVHAEGRRQDCGRQLKHERIDDQPEDPKRENCQRERYDFENQSERRVYQANDERRNKGCRSSCHMEAMHEP